MNSGVQHPGEVGELMDKEVVTSFEAVRRAVAERGLDGELDLIKRGRVALTWRLRDGWQKFAIRSTALKYSGQFERSAAATCELAAGGISHIPLVGEPVSIYRTADHHPIVAIVRPWIDGPTELERMPPSAIARFLRSMHAIDTRLPAVWPAYRHFHQNRFAHLEHLVSRSPLHPLRQSSAMEALRRLFSVGLGIQDELFRSSDKRLAHNDLLDDNLVYGRSPLTGRLEVMPIDLEMAGPTGNRSDFRLLWQRATYDSSYRLPPTGSPGALSLDALLEIYDNYGDDVPSPNDIEALGRWAIIPPLLLVAEQLAAEPDARQLLEQFDRQLAAAIRFPDPDGPWVRLSNAVAENLGNRMGRTT